MSELQPYSALLSGAMQGLTTKHPLDLEMAKPCWHTGFDVVASHKDMIPVVLRWHGMPILTVDLLSSSNASDPSRSVIHAKPPRISAVSHAGPAPAL
jgi:hypothetical protein